MNNKKLGVILLIISVLVFLIIFNYTTRLASTSKEVGCFNDERCKPVESALSLSHFAFGVIGFIFALGFFLMFFTRGEEAIVKTLEENKNKSLAEEKFDLILKGLDNFEKKVMGAIKEQDDITQSTLRIRTDMSKAKLSYVVNYLEERV
ncbi:MAG: helix-turn-helix domain-containing protein [Nanoarchaeota archaeon]